VEENNSKKMKKRTRRIISIVLSFGLLFQQTSFAQVAAELNLGNYISRIGSNITQEKFRPLHLRYFSYNNLHDNFKILLDKGDFKNLKKPELEDSTKTLLSYFLIGVTLPDDVFWVNLRPDSEDQVIDRYLAKTDVGRIMLAADLQLKKDTAAMTSPTTPEGREYWDRLYKKAAELYGYDNVTIPTLTRPWIVPGEIIVRESKDSAYVYKATLKVMLEQDYLKDSTTYNFKDERSRALNEYSSQLIRELIIPKLTKEVNSSKKYAELKQVYYSLILSRWFKLRFFGKTGIYASLINTRNLTNLVSRDFWSKTDYFKQYQKSFAKGEYNIKESAYTPTGQVIRSYFSGGIKIDILPTSFYMNRELPLALSEQSGMVTIVGNAAMDSSSNEKIRISSSPVDNVNTETYAQMQEVQIHLKRLERAIKKEYKAVALDIDGTIKKSSLPIDESILHKLVEYLRKGGILILATSRDVDSIDRVFFNRLNEIGIDLSGDMSSRIFICGDNGSSVFNYLEFIEENEKIVDSVLGFKPDVLLDKLYNNPLKPFLEKGLLANEDILITQNKIQIKLDGKKSENAEEIARSLNRYFSEQKMSLRVIKSKYRIDVNNINSSKMSGVEAIAEFLGIKTIEIAKIGDELNTGGNDSSFDDQSSFSVREHNSRSQYQVSLKLAKGIIGPEATSWLIDNLKFDFVETDALGITIDKNYPNVEEVGKKLTDYFRKPFGERSEVDRISLLSSLGINNPEAFMEEEAIRHMEKNDRAKTEEDKQLVRKIVKSSGIDYLLDPRNPDLRIAYRHKKGASRPNSKYAIPHIPKYVLAGLFKIKFKYSGLEKAIIAFLRLDGNDFLNTGGEIISFNVQDYGTNCVIKLNLRHPRVLDNKPIALFVKIDSWQCINDFGNRYESSGMDGYINEERFSISHAPFINYISQQYSLYMPLAYSDKLFLISDSGGQDYIAAIDDINTEIASGNDGLAQGFLFNAGMNNAFIDLFALYDRVVTLKKLGDKEPPLGGQFVVSYKDGKAVLSLVDYDWLFQLDEFWRRLSEFQGKDPCRLLGDLDIFRDGKSLLGADASESNLAIWSRAVTSYAKGYIKLWNTVRIDKDELFRKLEELYYEKVRKNCERVLNMVQKENRDEIIISWFNELPGTTKNMAKFLEASSSYRKYFDKQQFGSEEQKTAILEDMQKKVNLDREEQIRFVQLCQSLPPSGIAQEYAALYVKRIKGQIQNVLDSGYEELLREVFINYFSGLIKGSPPQENQLKKYEKAALDIVERLFKSPVILVMGYPGAGKSSISSLLAEELGMPHISKGDVLRIMHEKYPEIKDIPKYAVEMISRYIEENKIDLSQGVIIDWNARYAGPIELSSDFFDNHGLYLSTVIYVDVDAKTAKERLENRGRGKDSERVDYRIKQHEEVDLQLVEKYDKSGLVIHAPNGAGVEIKDAVAYVMEQIHKKNILMKQDDSSSPIGKQAPDKTGGIDFRVLPTAIQPMGSFVDLNFKLPQLNKAELAEINIAAEIRQVKNMLQAGIIPSGERIKELTAACVQKEEINSQIDNLLLCLGDMLKLEEENGYESSPELREAIVIIDSQG